MKRYIKVLQLDDEEKVQATSMYLANDVMLWSCRQFGEAKKGQCNLKTREGFVRKLKTQFHPEQVECLARKQHREASRIPYDGSNTPGRLKSMSITNRGKEDRLFFFLDELLPWANKELVRRDVKCGFCNCLGRETAHV